MLVQRDKQILKFVEEFGGITIHECASMFFSEAKHSYDLARKRLAKIADMADLKYFPNKLTGERVYCMDKKPTPHAVYIMDFYAKMINYGCKVLEYKLEPKWLNGVYRSDAFFKIEYHDTKRIICVEVDVLHTTDMTKYEVIYESKEIQNMYNGVFPLIVIVGDVLTDYYNDNFDVVFLDYKLNNFVDKVLII